MTNTRGPWRINAERLAYENPFMRVREYDVTRPDGKPGLYGVMSPRQLAIGVLPVHADGSVTLVGQHRFPLDRYSWEIPEGGGKLDGDPQVCGARELKEEAGLTAANWLEILQSDLSNSLTDEAATGYLAWDLTEGEPEPDGDEVLELRRIPFRGLLEEIGRGEIRDALTVVIALRAYYMAREGELDPALSAALLSRP